MPFTDIPDIQTELWEYIRVQFLLHPNQHALYRFFIDAVPRDIWSRENVDLVGNAAQLNFQAAQDALIILRDANFLDNANFRMALEAASPIQAAEAICIMKWTGLFTPDNLNSLASYPALHYLKLAFQQMTSRELFTQTSLDYILTLESPFFPTKILHVLSLAGLFTEERLNVILRHPNPNILSIFETLLAADMLNLQTFECMLNYESTDFEDESLKDTFEALQLAGLLTMELFHQVLAHHNLEDLAKTLNALNAIQILTRVNLEVVLQFPYLSVASKLLAILVNHRQLTQPIFDAIFVKNAEVLWDEHTIGHLSTIKPRNMQTFIDICNMPISEVRQAFINFANIKSIPDMGRFTTYRFHSRKHPHSAPSEGAPPPKAQRIDL